MSRSTPALHHALRAASSLLDAQRALLAWRPDVEVDIVNAVDVVKIVRDAPLAPDWSSFLLGLDDDALQAFETGGVDSDWTAAPPSLQQFVDDVRAATCLPLLLHDAAPQPARRHEPLHKQQQVDAFAQLVAQVAPDAIRIVDVGSGHGHLTRALAAAVARPTLGLERDATLTAHARSLVDDAHAAHVDFAVADVLQGGLVVEPGDCVVGLHACGELGDVVVNAAAASTGAASVVFVGCCLQKQRAAARTSLTASTTSTPLPKPLLGLSNLSTADMGVEAPRSDNLDGRCQRIALRLLLARAGVLVRPRAELEGLNRRSTHGPLRALVDSAFALRQLPAPSDDDVEQARTTATLLHAQFRRLSLPRTLLGRVIEVFVAHDRALLLAAHGFDVDVGLVFPPLLSPRNIAVVARRRQPRG